MKTSTQRAAVGTALIILILLTAVTGVILHLKKHGILIEPRAVIKVVHWCSGLLMVVAASIHGALLRGVFTKIRSVFRWFYADTWVVIIFLAATFITGFVKLLSPVKIPHLGLWHYWIGGIMMVAVAIHLVRGIPSLKRMIKASRK